MIEVIDNCAPAVLHKDMWAECQSPNWYFGYLPNGADNSDPFWRMDLDGNQVSNSLWVTVQSRCEALVGKRLEVLRQYANGHTYGLGGEPHRDDSREGTYTLLYFPMLEWAPNWDGETIFYKGGDGANKPQPTNWEGFDRTHAIRPLPNRAILFDARIPHEGRAPSRHCRGLRVTVAFKLRVSDGA